MGWQRQDTNLTEEFETEQLRFREHATKSVLKNSFVPIPLSHSNFGSPFLLLLDIAS